MRRKIAVIIMMFLLILPSFTAAVDYETTTQFTVKAYKSNPDANGTPATATLLSVYDALSRALNEVGQGEGKTGSIDVLPYLNNFLSTSSQIADPKKQVLFSYLVSGSQTGVYKLEIKIDPFQGPYIVQGDTWTELASMGTLDTYYQTRDVGFIFPKSHTSNDGTQSISGNINFGNKIQTAPVTYTITWTVSTTAQNGLLTDAWIAEGVIMMALDKTAYDNATTGGYRAKVTVNLYADK